MKRLFGILGSAAGLLIVVGLVIFLFLSLSGIRQTEAIPDTPQSPLPLTQPQPIATTAMVQEPFQSPLAVPTKAVEPLPEISQSQPPLCEVKQSTEAEKSPSQLDKFIFSEPKVIFSREAPIEIIEWLPDNQQVLVHVRNQTKQSIEVLDTTTGQTEVYADNLENANRIHWLPEQNAVVYMEHKTPEFSGVEQQGVWISQGAGKQPQLLLESSDIKTNAGQLTPEIVKAFNINEFSFDPEQWRYEKYPEDSYFTESWAERKFSSLVSPDGSKVVFLGVPWLYLVDLKTGEACEVDLGEYMRAYTATWSPDGKLLAMRLAFGYREESMHFNKLAILNTETGEMYEPDIPWSHVWDVQWFPDNRHLVVMGYSNDIEYPYQNQQLGIVDVLTEKFRLILPKQVFGGGSQAGFQLDLSLDGENLIVSCPITSTEPPLVLKNQICHILIER